VLWKVKVEKAMGRGSLLPALFLRNKTDSVFFGNKPPGFPGVWFFQKELI
jgi:hypothetical protein